MSEPRSNPVMFKAWSSHRYMTSNTCFGVFATREEADACIAKKLRETSEIDVWVHPWIEEVPVETMPVQPTPSGQPSRTEQRMNEAVEIIRRIRGVMDHSGISIAIERAKLRSIMVILDSTTIASIGEPVAEPLLGHGQPADDVAWARDFIGRIEDEREVNIPSTFYTELVARLGRHTGGERNKTSEGGGGDTREPSPGREAGVDQLAAPEPVTTSLADRGSEESAVLRPANPKVDDGGMRDAWDMVRTLVGIMSDGESWRLAEALDRWGPKHGLPASLEREPAAAHPASDFETLKNAVELTAYNFFFHPKDGWSLTPAGVELLISALRPWMADGQVCPTCEARLVSMCPTCLEPRPPHGKDGG